MQHITSQSEKVGESDQESDPQLGLLCLIDDTCIHVLRSEPQQIKVNLLSYPQVLSYFLTLRKKTIGHNFIPHT